MPELIPAAPGSPDLPRVMLDDDGDIWISWDGATFIYISPYVRMHATRTWDELAEDYPGLKEAEWTDA